MNYLKVISFLFVLMSFLLMKHSFAFFNFSQIKDPSWMVKIATRTDEGNVFGTGYLVAIGDMAFVRTSSHVTLGTENLLMTSGSGEVLKIIPDESLADNARDDHLIRIEVPSYSQALAYYSPGMKGFIPFPEIYTEILDNDRKRYIGKGRNSLGNFYIVPSWGKSKPGDFTPSKDTMITLHYPGESKREYLRSNASNISYMAEVKVYPGESGSPAFVIVRAEDIRDLKGNYYRPEQRIKKGYVPIILGHIQNFQLFFSRSNFSHPQNAETIVQAYLGGKRGTLDRTKWMKFGGHIYRVLEEDSIITREVNLLGEVAGEVEIKNLETDQREPSEQEMADFRRLISSMVKGSDFTKESQDLDQKSLEQDFLQMNVGNGIKMDGGECSEDKTCQRLSIGMGMIYKNQPISVFEVFEETLLEGTKSYHLYASWENYLYLKRSLGTDQVLEYVPVQQNKSIGELIEKKADDSVGNHYTSGDYCYVDRSKLKENRLFLFMQTHETVELDLSLPGFFPITFAKARKEFGGEIHILDLRGLFSVDASDLSTNRNPYRSQFNYFKEKLYIRIRHPEFRDVIVECKIR